MTAVHWLPLPNFSVGSTRPMSNMLDSTLYYYHDSAYPSQCRLQRLFNPRSKSMYESAPTRGRDSQLLRSNQSFNAYKRLPSSASSPSKVESYKAQLPVGPRPPRDRMTTASCREFKPASMVHTPSLRKSVPPAILTSHRMSESYLDGRPLSPSFLDLSPPSPDYHSASATCVSAMTSPKTSTPRLKRKGKPPPLILRDSFHCTGSQSPPPTLPIPPNNAKAELLTPTTPFTPISPRYRVPSEKEQFRRRLLKLQRTLGEQITPGLVVRPKPCSETTASPPDNSKAFIKHHQRGASLNSTCDHFPTRPSTRYTPTNQDLLDLEYNFVNGLPFGHKRKNMAPVPSSPSVHSQKIYLPETVALSPMTLTAFAGPGTPKNVASTAPSFEFVLSYDVQDSSSEDEGYDSPPVFSSPFDDSCTPCPLEFDDLDPPSLFNNSCPPSRLQSDYRSHAGEVNSGPYLALDRIGLSNTPSTPGVKRKERSRHGWSGEWNQPHIQDVIEKLRIL